MSPFEQHDEHLKDLELGGSGQKAPEVEPEPDPDGVEAADADEEPLEGLELDEELEEDEVEREEVKTEARAGHGPGPLRRLYRGETSFDFVGRRKWWFLLSTIIIVAGLVSLGVRGLNLGIDFKGGTAWTVQTSSLSQTQATKLVTAAGLTQPTVEVLGSGKNRTIEVQADLNALPASQKASVSAAVEKALATGAHVGTTTVSVTHVGPTWGSQVTQRALIALIVFFIVVGIYISFRFEPKMALAAFIAMVHDLLVTIGVYSLAGFQVTPDTVIAVLTILGYSLYDTVVVFDRVRDNSKGFGASGRMTYSEMVNLSMNQTLARSVNTSLVAILPVLAVLIVGAEILGAVTLQDYGLALTVGLLSGAYSSIFIASPVLAMLKEREPRYAAIRQRLDARGERIGLLTPSAAAAMAGAGASTRAGARQGKAPRSGAIRPGQSKSGSRAKGPSATSAAGASSGGAASGGATAGGAGSAGQPSTGAAKAGAGKSSSTATRRPPPRPRKGGSKGKKRR